MNIVRKVRAVEKLFKTLEKDVQSLKEQTGIHCIDGCVKCCTTSNIVATSIEFYPLAYHLYKNGLAQSYLSNIYQLNDSSLCPFLNTLGVQDIRAGCLHYEQRGLICRIFPYNHHTNKYGVRMMSACKPIKLEQSEQVNKANEILKVKPIGPKASNYYQRLQFIDYYEAEKLYPIGEAIRIAIEKIITYFHYTGKRAM